MKRANKSVAYHGRHGHPVVHHTGTGRKFIMVRAKGGGTKRLYNGSKFRINAQRKGTSDKFARLHI